MSASVILVEGVSDAAALAVLGRRLGCPANVVEMGGATNVARFVRRYAGQRIAGLCDANEERHFRRVLAPDAIFVCVVDLEDEFIRAFGVVGVEELLAGNGDLDKFRTFQNQPAQRERTIEQQLRRFFGTTAGRKERYAIIFAEALPLDVVPAPLRDVLSYSG